MDNNFMLTDDILWDYADGFLEGEEKLRVDAYLQQNPAQQARLETIRAEKRSFSDLTLEKPKAGFAQQVLKVWAMEQAPAKIQEPSKTVGRDWFLWSIAAAFGLMIALPFLLAPSAAPSGLTFQIPEQYLPQVKVPTFDWTGFFNSALLRNFLLFSMAFMGLKLLDKYLQVRRMRLSGQ